MLHGAYEWFCAAPLLCTVRRIAESFSAQEDFPEL